MTPACYSCVFDVLAEQWQSLIGWALVSGFWVVVASILVAIGPGLIAITYYWLTGSLSFRPDTTNPARCDYCATDTDLERPFTCPQCGGPNEPKG